MKNKSLLFLQVFAILLFFACKKEPVVGPPDPPSPPPPSSATELQLIADSVYLFSREIYFWDSLRLKSDYQNFNPRQYVDAANDAVTTAKNTIAAIRNYKIEDKTKQFSYATSYDEAAGTKTVAQTINSYGFYYKPGYSNRQIYPENPLGAGADYFSGYYVRYVYKNSDAGQKGVQRGWKIISVNGTDMTKMNNASVAMLNNMFYHETVKSANIVFQKSDGQNVTLNLSITTFVPNSVLYREKLVTSTGKNVGYLVYNFFGKYADTKADLDEAIQYFKTQGVNEIVIDLRYNRGGYTQMQNYLSNNFAPASANGGVMYKMHYNSDLQAGNYTMMRTRHTYNKDYYSVTKNTYNYSTINNFSNTKLYVIVGNSTASASELFINNIIPYLNANLILIGDNNTYGKPVGFFPIDLFKKVTFWTVSFETKNKNDAPVSYSGIAPNYRIYDGVDKAWGDATEDCLKAAINLIDGKTVTSAVAQTTVPRNVVPIEVKHKEVFEHSNLLYR